MERRKTKEVRGKKENKRTGDPRLGEGRKGEDGGGVGENKAVPGGRQTAGEEGWEEKVRSPAGRAAPGASNPSCKLRGINGRQLARLSTVFLASPEEDEQSVGAGRGASLAQPVRPRLLTAGSPPGTRERDQTRSGEALSSGRSC